MRQITNFTMPQQMIKNLIKNPKDFDSLQIYSVTFNLMGINRLQSTLICLLKDSYVQQSQRYVKNTIDGFVTELNITDDEINNKYIDLLNKTIELYNKMTEIKEESKGKSRTTIKDYKHGIPIEDARYLLPLSAKTNMSVTMSGDKFSKFLELLHTYKETIFRDLYENMLMMLTVLNIQDTLLLIENTNLKRKLFADNELEIFEILDGNKMEIDSAGIDAICRGILMSTTVDPSKRVDEKYPTLEDRQKLINRVAGYGHTSVLEQYRFNSVMKCSLVTFHQLIRHRMLSITPVSFDNLLNLDKYREHVTPKTIEKSIFVDEYKGMVKEWREFTSLLLKRGYTNELPLLTMLNGDEVLFNYTANTRADVDFLNKRLCVNAQWEIRNLARERVKKLRETEIGFIYDKFAKADCHLPKGCQEGAYSCLPAVREAAKLESRKITGLEKK